MSKSNIDDEVFLKNLSNAKAEDLVVFAKIIAKDKKLQRSQVIVSTAIATTAGAAIFSGYLFPELSLSSVAIGSCVFALITVAISFWQHKRESIRNLRRILRNASVPTEMDIEEAEKFRKEIIEALQSEKK